MGRITVLEVVAALANLAPAHREGLLDADDRDELPDETRTARVDAD